MLWALACAQHAYFFYQKNGMEFMPLNSSEVRIGYDDPTIYLPEDIQAILNSKMPFFG